MGDVIPLPSFTLLPAEDPQLTPDEQMAAAVAGALAVPAAQVPVAAPAPVPFGRSWQFDWQAGQFINAGASPADTSGLSALQEWCLMAVHSARYAHPVFSDEFGMENPDSVIGYMAIGEVLADWQSHLIDALLVHDRITSVDNVSLDWDPTTGVLTIVTLDIITDEDDTVTVSDVTLLSGGAP